MNADTRARSGRWFWALLLILLGTCFLLDNLDVMPAGRLVRTWWPLLLVLLGIKAMLPPRPHVISGGVIAAVGTLLLLEHTGVIHGSLWTYLWPSLLIFAGLWLLVRPRPRRPTVVRCAGEATTPPPPVDRHPLDLDIAAVFSGFDRTVESSSYRSGKVTAVFGSARVDSSRVTFAGPEAHLEAAAVFGHVELRVPGHWRVVVRADSVFAEVEDRTVPPTGEETPPVLYLKADVVFGGLRILPARVS